MPLQGTFRYDGDLHRYTVGDHIVPGISTVLKVGGVVSDKWFTQRARETGSLIHQVTHWLDNELITLNEVQGVTREKCLQWQAFKADNPKMKIRRREHPVVNRKLGFATMLDVAGYLKGPMTLNIKSGAPLDWHGVQRAAEVLAWKGKRDTTVRRYTLYLRRKSYRLVEHIYESDFDEFERCLATWREQCHHERKHGPLKLLSPLRSRRRLLSPKR